MSTVSYSKRTYDLIIYGATGFTGRLAAEYVVQNYPHLSFALAGRNLQKLQALRTELQKEDIPLLVADAVTDPASLDTLAAATKVIANYAGTPFLDKALPVVAACVAHGTCYTDITGEVFLQRASYDRYHAQAVQTQALIVHACGYDSVPSDLGALLAARAMQERHGCPCRSLTLVAESNGGVSGGTIHTAMGLLFAKPEAMRNMPGVKESQARGSYALDPEGATGGPDTSDSVGFGVSYDRTAQQHVIPFVMAGANAPVVRKSNALFNYRYGKNCSYKEVQAVPSYLSGLGQVLGLGVFGVLMVFPPTRWLMLQYVLPHPGQGPSREIQEKGFFTSHVYAVGDTPSQPVAVAYVKSGNAGDPGYKATARMSIEASVCMALEREKCHAEGGVLTPATALGQVLIDRLNATGMQLGVVADATKE